jgi:PAS domain S-box-containing protein
MNAISAPTNRRSISGPRGLQVDLPARQAWVGDRPVELSALGFDMLCLLLDRCGDVVTTDDLAQLVWGHERAGEPSYIHTAVYRLRTALNDAGASNLIRNVRGVGYTMVGRRAPDNLMEEQGVLEAAIRAAHTPIMILDTERRLRFANRPVADLLGYEESELEQIETTNMFSPPERDQEQATAFQQVIAGSELRNASTEFVRSDGSRLPVKLDLSPILTRGSVVGVLVEIRK